MDTKNELAALKALAEKATPGPWDFDTAETPIRIAGGEVVGGDALPYGDVYTVQEYETPEGSESLVVAQEIGADNGSYIAAANPVAILSLISRIEQQAARIAGLEERLARADEVANAGIDAALSYKLDHPTPAVDLSGLTRYDHAPGTMIEDASGYWCKFTDVQSLLSAPVVREGKMTKERMLDLATESGIDTDTDGDIWGSTNGALLKFAESVEREVLATGKDSTPSQAWNGELPELDALLTRITDAHEAYERYGEICSFEGQPMIYAASLLEIASLVVGVKESTSKAIGAAVAGVLEQAARICQSHCACDNGEDDEEVNRILRNRAAQIRSLSSNPVSMTKVEGWISVEDARRPEGAQVVLVAVRYIRYSEDENGRDEHHGYEVTEGEYMPKNDEGGDYFTSFSSPHGDQEWITHWMPLPAAPHPLVKGEKDGDQA